MLDEKTLGALAAGAASSIPGAVLLGLTTTTAVTLPVTGVVMVAAAVGYGVYKGVQLAQSQDN